LSRSVRPWSCVRPRAAAAGIFVASRRTRRGCTRPATTRKSLSGERSVRTCGGLSGLLGPRSKARSSGRSQPTRRPTRPNETGAAERRPRQAVVRCAHVEAHRCRSLAEVRHACHLLQTSSPVDPPVRWSLPTLDDGAASAYTPKGELLFLPPMRSVAACD